MQNDERLIATGFREEDEDAEQSLRPRSLAEYVGQDKVKKSLCVYMQAATSAASRWITCCCTARPGWARRRWRASSPTKWATTSASPAAPPSSARAIWRPF